MTCPTTETSCLLSCGKQSEGCQPTLGAPFSNMFGVEPQPTGFPIGSDDLVRPSLRPHSSDIARALSLIDEAWLIVHRRSTNNVKQRDGRRNALDLLEETAVWMKDIDNG